MKALYVIASDNGLIKLGRSQEPDSRLRSLQTATGNMLRLCHTTELRDDCAAIENAAHRLLADKRKAGEWFDVGVDEAIDAVRAAVRHVEYCARIKDDVQRCKGCKPRRVQLIKARRRVSEPKSKPFGIRMRASVYEAGLKAAADQNRSLALLMNGVLIDYLREHGYLPAANKKGGKRK